MAPSLCGWVSKKKLRASKHSKQLTGNRPLPSTAAGIILQAHIGYVVYDTIYLYTNLQQTRRTNSIHRRRFMLLCMHAGMSHAQFADGVRNAARGDVEPDAPLDAAQLEVAKVNCRCSAACYSCSYSERANHAALRVTVHMRQATQE